MEAMTTRKEIELFAKEIFHTALTLLIHSDSISSRSHLSQFLDRKKTERGDANEQGRLLTSSMTSAELESSSISSFMDSTREA